MKNYGNLNGKVKVRSYTVNKLPSKRRLNAKWIIFNLFNAFVVQINPREFFFQLFIKKIREMKYEV